MFFHKKSKQSSKLINSETLNYIKHVNQNVKRLVTQSNRQAHVNNLNRSRISSLYDLIRKINPATAATLDEQQTKKKLQLHPRIKMDEWFNRHNKINDNWFISLSNPTEYASKARPDDHKRTNIFEATDGCGNFIEVTDQHELLVHYMGLSSGAEYPDGDGMETNPQEFIQIFNLILTMCRIYGIHFKDTKDQDL